MVCKIMWTIMNLEKDNLKRSIFMLIRKTLFWLPKWLESRGRCSNPFSGGVFLGMWDEKLWGYSDDGIMGNKQISRYVFSWIHWLPLKLKIFLFVNRANQRCEITMEHYPDWHDALSGFHGPGGYWHVLKNGIDTYTRLGFAFLVMETNTSNIIRGLEQKYFNGLSVYVSSYRGMCFTALHYKSKKRKD